MMAVHAYAIPKNDLDGKERLRQIIKEKSLMRGEEFTLASGQTSGYFFNMKKTMMDPEGANLIAEEILKLLESEGPVSVGGLEMGAVPILSVLCAKSYYTRQQIPAFFVRKMKKGHGTNQLIDGNLHPGSNVVLVDDVTTTGGSVMKAVEAVRAQNCTITRIITVVDREEGAIDNLAKFDITLVPIFTRADFEQ